MLNTGLALDEKRETAPKLWRPRRVLVTPSALEWEHGRAILERAAAPGSEIAELKSNRLTGLSGENERQSYVNCQDDARRCRSASEQASPAADPSEC